MLNKKALAASSAVEPVFVEDVFSTYLYTGNGSTQTITNGIDLAGEGGLVWFKNRGSSTNNLLLDTVRGASQLLQSNLTNSQTSYTGLNSFNSDGFSLNVDPGSSINASSNTYASWTFRKQPKFFDVVTYTGNGANRTISHNLGSVPGCIIVKRTDTTGDWQVYHRANTANPETDYLVLNSTAATADSDTRWNDTLPTSTVFSLGTDATVNANGGTYVAYLFAHDAGGFGETGNENAISCGSLTTDGSQQASVTLGYEPQFLILKKTSGTGDWFIVDNMRGLIGGEYVTSSATILRANTNAEEATLTVNVTATGFNVLLDVSSTYVYIAIRRGPMKTPTDATKVFSTRLATEAINGNTVDLGLTADAVFVRTNRGGTGSNPVFDRLRGMNASSIQSSSTAAESAGSGGSFGASQTQVTWVSNWLTTSTSCANQIFRRAPGFFDIVCDIGTGSAHTISHNLGVVPELIIRKKRSATDNWIVYAGDATDYLILNTNAATADLDTMWNDTAPTASVFTVGTNDDVNQSTGTFVTYLFASCPGVSKVGSYTGNGSSQTINCGFTAGARFVLIKRTDSTGDWVVFDSARGIVAGNDPYLRLNSTAAEVTDKDAVDTDNTGFVVNETTGPNVNTNNASYIYLAIA